MLNEINDRERHIPCGIIYMWNLKKKKSKLIKTEKNGCRLQSYSQCFLTTLEINLGPTESKNTYI